MTVVLQHRFWDLIVTDERFEVKLTFDGIPERLVVPFAAIKVFFDPSVPYGLQFEETRRGRRRPHQLAAARSEAPRADAGAGEPIKAPAAAEGGRAEKKPRAARRPQSEKGEERAPARRQGAGQASRGQGRRARPDRPAPRSSASTPSARNDHRHSGACAGTALVRSKPVGGPVLVVGRHGGGIAHEFGRHRTTCGAGQRGCVARASRSLSWTRPSCWGSATPTTSCASIAAASRPSTRGRSSSRAGPSRSGLRRKPGTPSGSRCRRPAATT